MKTGVAALLILEAVLCFGPVGAFLLLGVLMSPVWLIAALTGHPSMFLMTLGGAAGAYGLFSVLNKIIQPETDAPRPLIVWVCIAAGLCTLIPVTIRFLNPNVLWLTLGAPILATLHFMYLARQYLFGCANKSMEPTR